MFNSTSQADLLSQLQGLGFKAANTAIDVYANKNIKMPSNPPPPTAQYVPIQTAAAPAVQGIDPKIVLFIAAGLVVVILLVK